MQRPLISSKFKVRLLTQHTLNASSCTSSNYFDDITTYVEVDFALLMFILVLLYYIHVNVPHNASLDFVSGYLSG